MGDGPPPGRVLPPPETGFLDWIKDATTAVQAKYPKATIIDAVATKKNTGSGTSKSYTLDTQARFSTQDPGMVTVTKPSGDYKISDLDDVPQGAFPVKDMTKILDPYPIVRDNTKLSTYNTFSLTKFSGAAASKPKGPDQPYYTFKDATPTKLAMIGALDGKTY